MRSLMFQGVPPFTKPPTCEIVPCRSEVPVTMRRGGRMYTFILRDKIVPEDPYLVMVKAAAFAIITGEYYKGMPVGRDVRDWLIKSTVVI